MQHARSQWEVSMIVRERKLNTKLVDAIARVELTDELAHAG
jgi:hypothetical protein